MYNGSCAQHTCKSRGLDVNEVQSASLDLFGEDFIHLALDPLLAMRCVGQ